MVQSNLTPKNEELFRPTGEPITNILDSISDAIVTFDHEWRYTFVNRAAVSLLGKTAEELLGNRLWDLFPDAIGTNFEKEIKRCAAEERITEFREYYPPHKRWYNCRCYPSPSGVSLYFTDVSEQQAYRRSQRLATIGTLAAGIAHDINNPLSAILNSAQAALHCEVEPFVQECLQNVVDSADRCGQIVQDLLKFARQEPLEQRPENLKSVIDKAIQASQSYLNSRPTRIDVTGEDNLPLVPVNALEIEQAVVNLLRNSVQAEADCVHFSLELDKVDNTVRLRARDDGCGLTAEAKEHAFEPFYSTRYNEGGSGLGLSIVHGIVKAHGGSIEIDGALGDGTCVTISLPTAREK